MSNYLSDIQLTGLEIAPSQVRGAIRIVPLLKHNVRYDLRLQGYKYEEPLAMVSLSGELFDRGIKYCSYIPDGLVMSWSNDGSPVVASGTQLGSAKGKKMLGGLLRVIPRMSKKIDRDRLRFLPLHLAMEGFLAMFFSGPEIAWSDYSRRARSQGLNPRWEISYSGRSIIGLEDALRVFEIHQRQVGVIIFVAEELASVFVVPTPEDYRALHTSLLQDFYGELIFQYACMYQTTYPMNMTVDDDKINNLEDLKQEIEQVRTSWADWQGFMASSLLQRPVKTQQVYKAGSFTLQRFLTDLDSHQINHIGEAIVRDTGELEYLKTYRLSETQTKRIHLLSKLAEYNWNLNDTAAGLKIGRDELIRRFKRTGLDYLLTEQATRLKDFNIDN
ncbi:MAG: hypothetical protein QNJ41_06545 [Xenococcaceae cyanobacterium MO_188.B32]|nr:hypothetical protein [Xenococcaceae cyanobacterium MO_188.B32]